MNKKFIEAFWSGTAQIAASKLLDLWQTNNNKSILNIQDFKQSRWLQYKTELTLQNAQIILTEDQAGTGTTTVSNVVTQPDFTNQIDVGADLSTLYGIKQANKVITTTRGYSVTRISGTKVFFDDTIPGNTSVNWRYSNTLIASIDLENEGVSEGDSLIIRIYRNNKHYDIETKIVGVAGNKAGFVWSKTILQPTVAKNGIDNADQVNGAKALGVELELDNLGAPIYKNELLKVYNELTSIAWKRLNYEKKVNTITVLGEVITLEPIYILRYSKIRIDNRIKAIPTLQEYIQQPELYIENNKYYRTDNNIEVTKPMLLNENKEYTILSNDGLSVTVNTLINSNKVQIPFGNLDKFKIEVGDTLVINKGLNAGKYTIVDVLNKEEVLISKKLTTTEIGANGKLLKRITNSWLIFNNTDKKPNLWAETTFIDNYEIIESNFGGLVALSYNDFKSQGLPFSYKTAIAGLMYALTKGPQIDNIKLGATILLGLPFTYNAGVITEIEKEYKLNLVTGAPEYGRIVVIRDSGIEDVYYYPRGKQLKINGKWVDISTELSGLAINPNTGKEYTIGDFVPKYTALTKGIDVADYRTNSKWLESVASQYNNISKYHTFYLRANTDLYGVASLTFVADYISKIKPTYISVKTVATQAQKDTITVTDKMLMRATIRQFDGLAFGIPPDVYRNRVDVLGMVDWMGRHYYRVFRGNAAMTQGNDTITTTPGVINNPSTDSPLVRPGDIVKFVYSKNTDNYNVLAVPTDSSIQLNTSNIQSESGTRFSVYRHIKNPIMSGSVDLTQGTNTISITGKKSAGVCPGDCIVFYTNSAASYKYTIVSVGNNIELNNLITEPTGTYSYYIYRKGLAARIVGNYALQSDGTNWIQITNPDTNLIVYTGWNLKIDDVEYRIIDWKPSEYKLYIGSILSAGNYTGSIKNTDRVIGFNTRDKYVEDKLSIKLFTNTNATLTSGSTQVTTSNIDLTTSARPGDLLKIVSGGNNTDCGSGPGIYPIASVTDANTLQLTRQLTVTENKKFYIIKNY